jgi:hypothetical protein
LITYSIISIRFEGCFSNYMSIQFTGRDRPVRVRVYSAVIWVT